MWKLYAAPDALHQHAMMQECAALPQNLQNVSSYGKDKLMLGQCLMSGIQGRMLDYGLSDLQSDAR